MTLLEGLSGVRLGPRAGRSIRLGLVAAGVEALGVARLVAGRPAGRRASGRLPGHRIGAAGRHGDPDVQRQGGHQRGDEGDPTPTRRTAGRGSRARSGLLVPAVSERPVLARVVGASVGNGWTRHDGPRSIPRPTYESVHDGPLEACASRDKDRPPGRFPPSRVRSTIHFSEETTAHDPGYSRVVPERAGLSPGP